MSDMTGDGLSDLLWRNTGTGQIAIWELNGASVKNTYALPICPTEWVVAAIGDYNADGVLDIAWRNTINGNNAYWYLGYPAGKLIGTPLAAANGDLAWEIAGPR